MGYLREVEITLKGDISLIGETVTYSLNDEDFRILGRALELMYLTKGDRSAVGIMLEAQYAKNGILMKGTVDAALAMYLDITNYIVLSCVRVNNTYPV